VELVAAVLEQRRQFLLFPQQTEQQILAVAVAVAMVLVVQVASSSGG